MTKVFVYVALFWLGIHLLRPWVCMVLNRVELALFTWLHGRAMDRALSKPLGTMAYRQRLDHGDDADD